MKTVAKYFWGVVAMVLVLVVCHLLNKYVLKDTFQISDMLAGMWSGMTYIGAMDFYKKLD